MRIRNLIIGIIILRITVCVLAWIPFISPHYKNNNILWGPKASQTMQSCHKTIICGGLVREKIPHIFAGHKHLWPPSRPQICLSKPEKAFLTELSATKLLFNGWFNFFLYKLHALVLFIRKYRIQVHVHRDLIHFG